MTPRARATGAVTRPPEASRLASVRLLAMDVDGVLTDGGICYTERGDELKRFDVRDGQGLVLLRAADACYVGDDVGDLPAMALIGLPVAVADAVPVVRKAAVYVTHASAGLGAIRELCDLILSAKQKHASRSH